MVSIKGVPVLTGPAVFNFQEIYSALRGVGAAVMVGDTESLAHGAHVWLNDPAAARRAGERGRDWMVANQGALDRLWAVVDPYLASGGGPVAPMSRRLAPMPAGHSVRTQ